MAFAREWGWEPPVQVTPEGEDTEEWIQPEALIDALSNGPLTLDHLSDTLAARYDAKRSEVKAKLRSKQRGRYRAWSKDGEVWEIPARGKKEEF